MEVGNILDQLQENEHLRFAAEDAILAAWFVGWAAGWGDGLNGVVRESTAKRAKDYLEAISPPKET